MTYQIVDNKIIITGYKEESIILVQDNGMTADEQAQLYISEHEKTIKEIKLLKLEDIKNEVRNLQENSVISSSVGFTVNARREDIQNIDELITLGVTSFRGADNVMHTVTATDLQTIRAEIVAEGLSLYNRKWAAEDALASATTESEVMAITL